MTIQEKLITLQNINKSKDTNKEKYGSFKGMSEKIWKAYYEKKSCEENPKCVVLP